MNNSPKNECKTVNLNIKDILVWNNNPRYLEYFPSQFDIDYSDDTEYIKSTIKKEIDTHDDDAEDSLKSFKDLLWSFITKGFISDNDSIFVKEINENKKYVVLEGNRRICAIKILNNIKSEKDNVINWFIDTFTLDFYNKIKPKLENYSSIEKIECKLILGNDIDYIKSKIYKRDQINAIGKKFWSRTIYFSHILSEYKLIKENNHKFKLNKLSILYDKNEKNIKNDFENACWVFQCLNIYKEKHKDFKINSFKSSALELSRSKIKDPIKNITLQKLFEFKFDEKTLKFIPEKNMLNITTEKLAEFLIESYKSGYYNTRGWKEEDNEKLVEFFYPKYKKRFADYLSISFKKIQEISKNDKSKSEFDKKNFTDDEIGNKLKEYFYTTCYFADKFFAVNNDLIEIIETIYEKTNEYLINNVKNLKSQKIVSEVHFAGLIDGIFHEINSQQFLKKSTLLNFPYAKYSLIFRNVFTIIISLLFIDEDSRNKIINFLSEQNNDLCNVPIVKNYENNDVSLNYINESDLCDPAWFASISLIGESLFYRNKGFNLPGFFTWNFGEDCKQKDIQNIFCKKICEIFCAFYKHMCSSYKIKEKQIKDTDIKFITFFIENKDLYDTVNRFIHNDMYIVNAYNNSPIEQIKDFFDIAYKLLLQLTNLFKLFIPNI